MPANWINVDPRECYFGTRVRGGWVLVGRYRLRRELIEANNEDDFVIGVWKKRGSYLLQYVGGDGRTYEHLIHPSNAAYNPFYWEREIRTVWRTHTIEDLESEVMPRPSGVSSMPRLPRS